MNNRQLIILASTILLCAYILGSAAFMSLAPAPAFNTVNYSNGLGYAVSSHALVFGYRWLEVAAVW